MNSFDGKDFNDKVDAERDRLLRDAEGKSLAFLQKTTEMSNRVEVARRIVNHYLETGEVKLPE